MGDNVSQHVVLVVEDEPLLRINAVSLLEDAGCATLEAGSADEAISLLESNANIRAVFTDIELPGSMDGLRLAAAIRDRWPPVELIVTSGQIRVTNDELPVRGRFLPKPYTLEELAGELRALHLCAPPANGTSVSP